MNMQNLMMQAKKMQNDIMKVQGELEKKVYEGKSQLVVASVNGKGRVLSVDIDFSIISSEDKEVLEDMVLLAINNALEKMEADREEKLGKYGKMFNGLM